MDDREIRRNRLRQCLAEDFGGRQVDMAARLDRQADYISGLLSGKRTLGEKLAREFESKLGKPRYWLDERTKGAARVAEPPTLYGLPITEPGVRVGCEWEKLHEPLRGTVQTLIEMLVAAQVRSARSSKKGSQTRRASRKEGRDGETTDLQ